MALLSAVLLLLLGQADANAALIDISTAVGNGADTFVSAGALAGSEPTTNHGAENLVRLERANNLTGTASNVNRKGYLRFDLSSVVEPILSIQLQLTLGEKVGTEHSPYSLYGLNDGHKGEAWLESGITWNDAPTTHELAPPQWEASTNGVLAGGTTFLGTFDTDAVAVGGLLSFSSAALLNFALSDTNDLLTLILVREDIEANNEGFAAKEHATLAAPTLEILTVPEPGTALMLATGGLACIGLRWRRRRARLSATRPHSTTRAA